LSAAGAVAVLALDEPPQASRQLWLVASLAALALHVGCLLFVWADTDNDSDLAFGAPALAIDVDLAAPNKAPIDLPAGPDQDASAASPQMVQQQEVLKQSDLPKDTPTETDDPARLVALDNAKKPVDDDPNVKPVQTAPSTESVAAEATATPSLENLPEAKRSTAPVLGIGDSLRKARVNWYKELSLQFKKHLRYPAAHTAQKMEVLVTFEIDRLGHLLSSSVSKSSGDASFDEAALAMLKRADPLPAPPPAIADEALSFTVPVEFKAPK
jgi:periplasmic protein TonB